MAFGQAIATARKEKGLSQKDLAARILKEDGSPISPQYLNDLEHDRRNPPSDFLLARFAEHLGLSSEYLVFLAGRIPADLRDRRLKPEEVQEAFKAFRKATQGR
jgi:transcriptional regulator with XRE-family HTH domain